MINLQVEQILNDYNLRLSFEEKLAKSLNRSDFLIQRDKFLLPIGKDAAIYISNLIFELKPLRILELGTSYGYSTLWLANTAKRYGGKIVTIDNMSAKSKFAKNTIQRAGLSQYVEFVVADAYEYIKSSKLKFDFVLMDLWKEYYKECFNSLIPKLSINGYVVSDNILEPIHFRPLMREYREYINSLHFFESKLVQVGNGLEVSTFKPTQFTVHCNSRSCGDKELL